MTDCFENCFENSFTNAEPKEDVHCGCYEDYPFDWNDGITEDTDILQKIKEVKCKLKQTAEKIQPKKEIFKEDTSYEFVEI